jgi:hypothetical protein
LTAFQTKTLRCYDGARSTAVWNYELGNTASFLPSIAVQIALFGGLDENAGLVVDGDVSESAGCH